MVDITCDVSDLVNVSLFVAVQHSLVFFWLNLNVFLFVSIRYRINILGPMPIRWDSLTGYGGHQKDSRNLEGGCEQGKEGGPC